MSSKSIFRPNGRQILSLSGVAGGIGILAGLTYKLESSLRATSGLLEFVSHLMIIIECVRSIADRFVPRNLVGYVNALLWIFFMALVALSLSRLLRGMGFELFSRRSHKQANPPRSSWRIWNEGEHFMRILSFAAHCSVSEAIQIMVPVRLVDGALVAAPSYYLQRLAQICRSRNLSVEYLFVIQPEIVDQVGRAGIQAFFALYKPAASVLVTWLTCATICRYQFRRHDRVLVLLGKKSGLAHSRDENGMFVSGREMTPRVRSVAEMVYNQYRMASSPVEDFLREI